MNDNMTMKSESEIRERLDELKDEYHDRMDLTSSNHALGRPIERKISELEWVLDE